MFKKYSSFLLKATQCVAAASVIVTGACGDSKPDDTGPKPCTVDEGQDPVIFGASHGIVTLTGLSGVYSVAAAGTEVAAFDINRSCGVLGTAEAGQSITMLQNDNQDDATQTPGKITELLNQGAVAIIGASSNAPTVAAVKTTLPADVLLAAYGAGGDELSGCTEAQLADAAITKQSTPLTSVTPPITKCFQSNGLFFRTAPTAFRNGQVTAQWAHQKFPTKTTAALIVPTSLPNIGRENGFKQDWLAFGNTVTSTQRPATSTSADFKTAMQALAVDNPQIVVVVSFGAALKTFFQAYVELRDDGTWGAKPASFNNIQFFIPNGLVGTWNDMGATALAAIHNQAIGVTGPYQKPESVAYNAFIDNVWNVYYGDGAAAPNGTTGSTYDATMLVALASIYAGTTEGQALGEAVRAVSSPPGEVIYPGELAKARKIIAEGGDIDYVGTAGNMDVNFSGNTEGLTWVAQQVTATGDWTRLLPPTDVLIDF